jgi:hypothetical protein
MNGLKAVPFKKMVFSAACKAVKRAGHLLAGMAVDTLQL